MKNTISGYILIVLMVIGIFKSLIPFAEYSLNQEYIVNQLCVNRSVPELNCNGKCYLKRRVTQISVINISTESPSIPVEIVIPDLSKFLKHASLDWNSLSLPVIHRFPKQFIFYSYQFVLKLIEPPELSA